MKMKTLLAFAALSILFNAGFWFVSNAQTGSPKLIFHPVGRLSQRDTIKRRNVLTFFPTNFVAATIKAGYEFKIAHNKGLKFMGSFGSSTTGGDFYGLNEFQEFGLEGQLRFYFQKDYPALNGFYLAPYVSFKSMNYKSDMYVLPVYPPIYNSSVGQVSNFSLGYVIGYQWIFNSSFVIDAFVGGGYNSISGNNSPGNLSNTVYAYRSGIDLHTGIGIGLAF